MQWISTIVSQGSIGQFRVAEGVGVVTSAWEFAWLDMWGFCDTQPGSEGEEIGRTLEQNIGSRTINANTLAMPGWIASLELCGSTMDRRSSPVTPSERACLHFLSILISTEVNFPTPRTIARCPT